MSRLKEFFKDKRILLILFTVFIVVPISFLFTCWLTDLWVFEDFKVERVPANPELLAHLEHNLNNVRCPAKPGLELEDFWRCIWRTSITVEGMELHRQILAENHATQEPTTPRRENEKRKKREVTPEEEILMRYKRQAPPPSLNQQKFQAILEDVETADSDTNKYFLKCMQGVFPGTSIHNFLKCVQRRAGGRSLQSKFLPSTYPPIKSPYDENKFPLLTLKETGQKLAMVFKPLGHEEKLGNFDGADPYLQEDFDVYLYQYNNQINEQDQPGWSYKGHLPPGMWHELSGDLSKFYVPLKKALDLKDIALTADLVQTYPGAGEIAESEDFKPVLETIGKLVLQNNDFKIDYLEVPLDIRWTKDTGYFTFNRFLLPLLTKNDIDYYKSKGLIDQGVNIKTDENVLFRNMFALFLFVLHLHHPANQIAKKNPTTGMWDPLYLHEDDIEFVDLYRHFISHFYEIDLPKYRKEMEDLGQKGLFREYESVRNVLRHYLRPVLAQMQCVRNMVKDVDVRLYNQDLDELIETVKKETADQIPFSCPLTNATEGIDDGKRYYLPENELKEIYETYFHRKEARQRYSLPTYPVKFPVCRHNDPSPIDIITSRSRKSSLRDYIFGDAAYRLNKFFMFFPLDSATLLTVGIVDGERYDDSSVRLTGGAVKGENLTFQYMHIHFGENSKSIGSEHWIDGKGGQMELQFVFTIAGSADSIKYWHVLTRVQNRLFQFREKLVIIIAVLVDVLETDEEVKEKIEKEKLGQDPYLFEPLAQAAYHFQRMNEINPDLPKPRGYVSDDPVFRFIDFIPRKSSKFYTYRGSLTYPPCFGYVIWSVYEQRLYMSKRQFDPFANIPAYGINADNYAHGNIREFDDIHVDDENVGNLNFDAILKLKRQRTIDRRILVGFHDVSSDIPKDVSSEYGSEDDLGGVVGEEIYYSMEDNAGGYLRPLRLFYIVLIGLIVLIGSALI